MFVISHHNVCGNNLLWDEDLDEDRSQLAALPARAAVTRSRDTMSTYPARTPKLKILAFKHVKDETYETLGPQVYARIITSIIDSLRIAPPFKFETTDVAVARAVVLRTPTLAYTGRVS